jgi:hypothetical protein
LIEPKSLVKVLNHNRIWFDSDKPFQYDEAPEYLQNFDDILLDFHGVIDVEVNGSDDEDIAYTISGGRDWKVYNPNRKTGPNATVSHVKAVQSEVSRLDVGAAENEWDDLFYAVFFKPLHDAWQPGPEDSQA